MSRLQKKRPQGEKRKKLSETIDASDSVKSASLAKPSPVVKSAKPEKSVTEPGVGNIFSRTTEFFREVKVELRKVVWPTRKQTTGTTVVVIIFVFIVAAFLGVFDYSLSKLVQVVLT